MAVYSRFLPYKQVSFVEIEVFIDAKLGFEILGLRIAQININNCNKHLVTQIISICTTFLFMFHSFDNFIHSLRHNLFILSFHNKFYFLSFLLNKLPSPLSVAFNVFSVSGNIEGYVIMGRGFDYWRINSCFSC